MTRHSFSTPRRNLLKGLGGLALAGLATPALARDHRGRGLDLTDRRDLLTALIKMRGATDGRLVISYVIGARYAVPDHRAIPMMGILAATFSRYRQLDADTFEARALELAFFTDLETGELLEEWKNPVTGTVVKVPQTRMGPSTLRVTADGLTVPRPSGEAAGLELKHVFLPPVVVGDHVWVTEDIRVDSGAQQSGGGPDGKPFVYTELSTYHARKSDLDNPDLATVPTGVSYQSLITYRPWMGFGDAPGHTIARGAGTRVGSLYELPPAWLALARKHHPDVVQDPLAVLG